MKLSEHKELKKEILALPPKEKDKLLLRLIARDKVLTEHLHFTLLEDESNLQERVELIKEQILSVTKKLKSQKSTKPKDILTGLRNLSKMVNHNLRVTKANFEDVELRLFLFNQTDTTFRSGFFSAYKNDEQQFWIYFIKAALVTLRKFYKLHEDLQFDLRAEMNRLIIKIQKGNATMAKDLGMPDELI